MDRLTYRRKEDGVVCVVGMTTENAPEKVQELAERLFDYEETGLTPEEFKESEDFTLALNKRLMSLGPIEHLEMLVRAEKEGRLVLISGESREDNLLMRG